MNICPIRCLNGSSDTDIAPECMRKLCAWWTGYQCAILTLAEAATDAVPALEDLSNLKEDNTNE